MNKSTSHYSKQDILEQYCITNKPLNIIDHNDEPLFGCLSINYCSTPLTNSKNSFLSVCLRHKTPSDECLYKNQLIDSNLTSNYPKTKYNFRKEDETVESFSMEKKKLSSSIESFENISRIQKDVNQSGFNREKHVSFARSYTLACFDESKYLSPGYLNKKRKSTRPLIKSEERLIDGKRNFDWNLRNSQQIILESAQFLEKCKKSTMKAQATQTELLLKNQQKLQNETRKLLKSQSENYSSSNRRKSDEHDALLRTYSEQPVKKYDNDNKEFLISNRLQLNAHYISNENNNADNEHFIDATENFDINGDFYNEINNNDILDNDQEDEILIDFKPNFQCSPESLTKTQNKNLLNLLAYYYKNKANSENNEQQILDFVFSSFSDSIDNDDDQRNALLPNYNSIDDDDFHEKYLQNEPNEKLKPLNQPDSIWNESKETILCDLDQSNNNKIKEIIGSEKANTVIKRQQLLLMKHYHQLGNKDIEKNNDFNKDINKLENTEKNHEKIKKTLSAPIADISESTTDEYITANSNSSKLSSYKTAIMDKPKFENSSNESTTLSLKSYDKKILDEEFSSSSASYNVEHEIDIEKKSSQKHKLIDGFTENDNISSFELNCCLHCGNDIDIYSANCNDFDNQENIVQPPIKFSSNQDQAFKSKLQSNHQIINKESFELEDINDVRLKQYSGKKVNEIENLTDLYDAPLHVAEWVFISEFDEYKMWTKNEPINENVLKDLAITHSEIEFQKRFRTLSHRMVHRKACLEMYKRQESNTFDTNKTVTIRKAKDEFGVRIHGSRPVVVSAIEPNSPAEKSGLEIGDIIISINSVNLMEKNHTEIVKIANSSSNVIHLNLFSIKNSLLNEDHAGHNILFGDYLWKLNHRFSNFDTNSKWLRRWFCLKANCYLYQYRNKSDIIPVSIIIMNESEIVSSENEIINTDSKLYRLCIKPKKTSVLHLASNCRNTVEHFQNILRSVINIERYSIIWQTSVIKNQNLKPNKISNVEFFGNLLKLDNNMTTWNHIYCILKQSCLYIYKDEHADKALGYIMLLGYKVQLAMTGGKRHVFELCPVVNRDLKHFYFYTDSEMERKKYF